ncbi:MAG: hypothetical protein LC749_07000 [Actinobacteria bacterium]|nr:hypothetical protein [Actinomycetota bacterium]
MTPEQSRTIQAEDLKAVMVPYIGLAVLLLVIWVTIAVQNASTIRAEFPPGKPQRMAARRDHWAYLEKPTLSVRRLTFLGSRFLMTWLVGYFRATALIAILAGLAVQKLLGHASITTTTSTYCTRTSACPAG